MGQRGNGIIGCLAGGGGAERGGGVIARGEVGFRGRGLGSGAWRGGVRWLVSRPWARLGLIGRCARWGRRAERGWGRVGRPASLPPGGLRNPDGRRSLGWIERQEGRPKGIPPPPWRKRRLWRIATSEREGRRSHLSWPRKGEASSRGPVAWCLGADMGLWRSLSCGMRVLIR